MRGQGLMLGVVLGAAGLFGGCDGAGGEAARTITVTASVREWAEANTFSVLAVAEAATPDAAETQKRVNQTVQALRSSLRGDVPAEAIQVGQFTLDTRVRQVQVGVDPQHLAAQRGFRLVTVALPPGRDYLGCVAKLEALPGIANVQPVFRYTPEVATVRALNTKALQAARKEAEELAAAGSLHVGRILKVQKAPESGGEQGALADMMGMNPLKGLVRVDVTVTVTYELLD